MGFLPTWMAGFHVFIERQQTSPNECSMDRVMACRRSLTPRVTPRSPRFDHVTTVNLRAMPEDAFGA